MCEMCQKYRKERFSPCARVKHVFNIGYEVFKIDFTYKEDLPQVLFVGRCSYSKFLWLEPIEKKVPVQPDAKNVN